MADFAKWPTQSMQSGYGIIIIVVGIIIGIICVQHSWSHCWCHWIHIWHKYEHTSLTDAYKIIWSYGIYVGVYLWLIFCNSMVYKSIYIFLFLMDMCSNVETLCRLHEKVQWDICAMWQTYLFRSICQLCEVYVYQCFWSHYWLTYTWLTHGEASAHLFRSPRRQSSLSQYDRRCPCKGHTGKPLQICSGLSGHRAHEVHMIDYSEMFLYNIPLWEGVAVLKGLVFNNFYFETMWCLERIDFG